MCPCAIYFQHSVYTGFCWLFKWDKLTRLISSKFDPGELTISLNSLAAKKCESMQRSIISLWSTWYLENLSEQCKPRPTQKRSLTLTFSCTNKNTCISLQLPFPLVCLQNRGAYPLSTTEDAHCFVGSLRSGQRRNLSSFGARRFTWSIPS